MTRTEFINMLIKLHGYTSYLEIGMQKAANNFDKVIAPLKVSVDPDPKAEAMHKCVSDWFFEVDNRKFDLIFIDGLHHSDQVERDIINSLRVLNRDGIIVLHDCNPPTEKDQLVPRQHKVWYGDVWRAFVGFRLKYPDVISFCLDHDCGLGVIKYTTIPDRIVPGFVTHMNWDHFNNNRKELLGII